VTELAPDAAVEGEYPLHGVLTQEGEDTGDCRHFKTDSTVWENLPLPFRWAESDMGGHQGARHVGWIDSIERVGNDIAWEGRGFDPNFQTYMLRAKKCGVSVDCDDEEYQIIIPEGVDAQEPAPGQPARAFCAMEVYDHARIRAATAVDIPAFIHSWVELGPRDAETPVAEPSAPTAEAPALVAAALPTDAEDAPQSGVTHAGVMLMAADTQRVLMLQRALEEGDENGGLWEWPGGGIEDGEDPEAAARREFAEEVGVGLPADAVLFDWVDSGPYRMHRMVIPAESNLDIDGRETVNPDDPNGDRTEAVAWWAYDQIVAGAPIRPEVLANLLPLPSLPEAPQEDPTMTELADAPVETPSDVVPVDGEGPEPDVEGAEQPEVIDSLGIEPTIKSVLEMLGAAADPLAPTSDDVLVASAFASTGAAPVAPPDEWFEPFAMPAGTPVTVLASGQVFGRLAEWNSCHGSDEFAGQCVRPPSDPEARKFQQVGGQVLTASGRLLDVGTVTVGSGHADRRLGLVAALEHYDDAGTGVAVVRVKEDDIGIGLFGSVVANATPTQIAALRRAPLSGDWRKARRGGKWNLIAAHAVVTPGYATERGLVASIGPEAFISSGRVCGDCGEVVTPDFLPDSLVASVRSHLAPVMELATAEVRSGLAARMGDISALITKED
jgi:8-oxo-dGTP pyrophosphatase MutT (NUDIX family)